MDSRTFVEYYQAIDIINARESIRHLELLVAPHQSERSSLSAKKLFKKLEKIAEYERSQLSSQEASEAIRRFINGQ
jgi:hypothetical protein